MFIWIIKLLSILISSPSFGSCSLEVPISGAITVSTVDLIEQAKNSAMKHSCNQIALKINTPGGNLQSTRMIVETILDSKIPFVCMVIPKGAHAGSAGAILLQACHVTGAVAATSIGAATPILGDGKEMPEDLRKKMINDTTAWVEGLAKMRGRSVDFANKIVTEAKSLDGQSAQKEKAIDFYADSESELRNKMKGHTIKIGADEFIISFDEIQKLDPGLKNEILDLISDPQFAYMIFMGSLALLYFEITHPGAMVPGVLGGVGLILSLIAFHKLEVYWGGLLLMLLGMLLLIAEAFVTSFGALGIGGVVAFTLGSLFLFDGDLSGDKLNLMMILPTVFTLSLIVFGLTYLAAQTLKRNNKKIEDMSQRKGVIDTVVKEGLSGIMILEGERWKFVSQKPLQKGDHVVVTDQSGLVLTVEKTS